MKYGQVKNINKELLSDNWYFLEKVSFEYQKENGQWEHQIREVYDRGNGAAVLLFNSSTKKIILTRQFRMPTYLNGNKDGMMIEVCAGILENENPEKTILKEIEEETGYRIPQVVKVFESYMSPGSVKEILHFYIGAYSNHMKVSMGGGLATETENIEVLEISYQKAINWLKNGTIRDAKTIMLLQYALLEGILNQ